MELKQLEYFQMVGRLNNITRASEQLHVSQPSITTSIQRLEEELGVMLFDRSKRQMTLTPEGRVFLDRVENIQRALEDAVTEMKDFSEFRKGTLRLGVPPMIGTYLFPKILSSFSSLYPQIELSIVENGSLATRTMIEQGELDLGIIIISGPSVEFKAKEISKSEILVCLNKTHPLSKKKKIAMEDLKDEQIILMKEGFYHREIILERFEKSNIKPHKLIASGQLDTIKSLVASGAGVSFLLREVIENDERLSGIPLEDKISVSIGLAWNKDRYLSKASQTFIEFIVNLFNTA